MAGGDDADAYWEGSGAREVRVISNHEIAAQAGRYLADCGLLPGEGGLTATDVARGLMTPWTEGILNDGQVDEAALGAILELRRDDEDTAYDFSDGPQRRELAAGERAFLHRLIGLAAADPRFAGGEIVQRPVIRAVLGDGARPQARPLTARERDDIGWLVNHVSGEWRYARERPGDGLSPWVNELPGGDIARLVLLGKATTPRHGTPYLDGPVLVSAAGSAPPEPVPDGWVIGNAPVPLSGPITWRGDRTAHGEFYAAAPDNDDDPYGGWLAECADAHRVRIVTDEDAVAECYAFLGRYGCAAPEDAGMTIAEVARDLGYPLTAAGAEAATAAARATFVLQVARGASETSWYAVHGTAARDRVAAAAARDGCLVTPSTEIPLGPASAGARDMVTLALHHGWDAVYIRRDEGEQVAAVNPDTGAQVSQSWDSRERLASRPAKLESIEASPRLFCMPAGPAGPQGSPGPVACGFPADSVAAPRRDGRAARPASRAARPGGRRATPGAWLAVGEVVAAASGGTGLVARSRLRSRRSSEATGPLLAELVAMVRLVPVGAQFLQHAAVRLRDHPGACQVVALGG